MSQKKRNPKISVIIPTYNRVTFLKKAVQSILNQTFPNLELIVVDDESTDNTQQAINKLRDTRIRLIKKAHGGQASSLNLGLSKAQGKYICFCDDDDKYLPEKLELCINFLESNQQYDACYTAFYFRLPNKKVIIKRFKHDDSFFFERLFSKGFLFINSMMFRRSVFSKIGRFNGHIKIGNDYDLLLRIAALGKPFGYIDVPTVIYNRHSASMTFDRKAMYSVISLLKKNFKKLENSVHQSFDHKIISSILFREGKYYFWQQQFQKARKFLIKAIVSYPFNKRPYIFLPFTFLGIRAFDLCINVYQKLTGNLYIRDCS